MEHVGEHPALRKGAVQVVRVPEFAPSFESAAYAAQIMRTSDTDQSVDKLIDAQLKAEAAFRARAYSAWPQFPDHPAAPALAALKRHEDGDVLDVSRVRGLSWLGKLLGFHADDWRDRES